MTAPATIAAAALAFARAVADWIRRQTKRARSKR